MRFKTDKEFQEMLRRSHLKVRGSTAAPAPKPVASINTERMAAGKSTSLSGSDLEVSLAEQIALAGLPAPVQQYHHLRGSKHTLDFAWPELKIGCEVQGMVHRIKGTFRGDIKKRALGLLQGWRVLEVGGAEIRDGTAIEWLRELLTRGEQHVKPIGR